MLAAGIWLAKVVWWLLLGQRVVVLPAWVVVVVEGATVLDV